jgi:hypothetical protein
VLNSVRVDKQYPALGFGAKLPDEGEVSFEFFMNGRKDSPFCQGVEGVLQAYYNALNTGEFNYRCLRTVSVHCFCEA